jgi:hypothetical protein
LYLLSEIIADLSVKESCAPELKAALRIGHFKKQIFVLGNIYGMLRERIAF